MRKSLFLWLDHHPDSYWGLAGAASLLLVSWPGVILARDGAVLFLPCSPDAGRFCSSPTTTTRTKAS